MKKIALDNNKNVVSKSLRLCRVRCGMTDYELAGMCLALRVSPAELLTDFFREYSEQ